MGRSAERDGSARRGSNRVTDVNVRGVDKVLWHRLRVEALKRGLSMGALLNQIIREWLEKNDGD